MPNAALTTLLTHTATDAYGNEITTALIHRSAGLVAAGSGTTQGAETWLVRHTRKGDSCHYGTRHADKLDALDAYNARVGTFVTVAA